MDRKASPAEPLISAVVCTYNRSRLLGRALDSLAAQSLAGDKFEIILVDDGSTDGTRGVAEKFAGRATQFRAIHQANAGLGVARNTGWRAARAPLIAFLDDDAIAPPDWLQKISAAFAAADPRLAVLGGPIDPDWESPPPPWLTRDLMMWLTVFDLGPDLQTCTDRPIFGGANMAFRAGALREVGGFPEDLGRRGSSLLSHEESAIWVNLGARGWSNRYVPDLRVRHFVATERLRPAWFRRRLYWEGVSMARREDWPDRMTRFRHFSRLVGIAVVRFRAAEFVRPVLRPWSWPANIRWQTYVAYHVGYLREMLRRLGQPKRC